MTQESLIDESGVPFDAPRDEEQAAERERLAYRREIGLTAKQLCFVEEYVVDFNATQAAIRAGYSPETAYSIGSELLAKPLVRAELARRQQDRSERLEISADRVLQELAKLATFDPRKFFHPDGTPKSPWELDDTTAAALAGVEVQQTYEGSGENRRITGVTFKLKHVDKGQNLDRLCRIYGMYAQRDEGGSDVEFDVLTVDV